MYMYDLFAIRVYEAAFSNAHASLPSQLPMIGTCGVLVVGVMDMFSDHHSIAYR